MSYPLTPLQQGLVYHALRNGTVDAYLQQWVAEFREPVDTEALRRAWGRLFDAHEVLRVGFVWNDESRPLQAVQAEAELDWAEEDWRHVVPGSLDAEFDAFLRADRRRGIELNRAPLWRVRLLRTGDEDYRLVWTSHHAILDGRSRARLVGELFEVYEALCDGHDAPTLEPTRFGDFVTWLDGRDVAADERFWTEQLAGTDASGLLGLPSPSPSQDRPAGRIARERLCLSEEVTSGLRALAAAEDLTLNTLVQGAWALVLARFTDRNSVLFGGVRAGRASLPSSLTKGVGLFINTVPVALRVDPAQPLRPWLRELRKLWVAMRGHEHAPLSEIRRLVPAGALDFDTVVSFERRQAGDGSQPGSAARSFQLFGESHYPVVLHGFEAEWLNLEVEYDTSRVDATIAGGMLEGVRTVLAGIAADSERTLGELPLLGPDACERVLRAHRVAPSSYPRTRTVHGLFQEQVDRAPNAVALVAEDRVISYAELDALANRLAHRLIEAGAEPGRAIGVLAERSPELIVALIAVLKTGGAYLPLDPDYPKERLALLVREADVDTVVCAPGMACDLPVSPDRVLEVDVATPPGPVGDRRPVSRGEAEDLAYILFTSGSTGAPKAVPVRHRSVVGLLFGVRYADLGPDRVFLQLAPIAFDASTFEIWGALLHGGRLVLAPTGPPDFARLAEVVERHGVDMIWLTAALFNAVVDTRPGLLRGVRHVLTGGETLSVPHVVKAREHMAPEARLTNGYGPTECTTFACCYDVPADFDRGERSVPIGRPVAHTQAFVLDEALRPVPDGGVGELCLGGDGLAVGYLNDPELTARRFVRHPYDPSPEARLYRTGDRARWLPDGNLEFLGRRDAQVKLRGFRIELGEIEHALLTHDAVAQAAVDIRGEAGQRRRLVAYVVPIGASVDAAELRAHLLRTLPGHMVPSAWVFVDALPRTPSGKLDRRALPAPASQISEPASRVPPRTPVEETLCALWEDVLEVPEVGIHDDFFDLGGDSLTAMETVTRIVSTLGSTTQIRTLFEARTIAELAARLDPGSPSATVERMGTEAPRPPDAASPALSRSGEQPTSGLPEEQPTGALPRASFGQERLWFLEQLEPGRARYNVPFAWRLGGPLSTGALERALEAVLSRHEALRTTFLVADGHLRQVARPAPAVALRRIDLTGLDEATRDAEVTRLRTEEGEAPFDLAADPMLRGALLTLGPQDHVLLLTFHHIAFDGWSMPVFMRDLRAAYAACRDGRTPSRSPVGSHAAHALAERARLTEDRLAVLRDFWSRRLDGLRSLELPVARRPVSPSHAGRHLDFTIDAGLSAQLTALCRTAGTTLHIVLLAALQALLAREAGQDDVAVAVPVALRDRPGAADEIGFFVNTLVMRTDLAGVLTVGQLIERVGRASLDAYDHRDMPFDRLVAELRPAREPGRTPFADVVFQLTDAWDGPMDLVGIEDERLAPQSLRARFDLEWHVRRSESTLLGTITYKADLFDNAYVRRLVDGFRAILGNMAEGVDSQLPAGMSQEAMTRSPTRRVQTGPPPTPHPGSEPRTEVEAQLAALWSEALQVPRVGIHDDFFALGGHSLLIAETAEALREVIGAEVPLHEIYTHPTIAGLLSAIDTPRSVDGSRTDPPPRAGLVPLRRGSADPLVLIHPASGLAAPYLPLVDTLHERESIYALEHPGPAHRSIRELAKHHVRLLRAAQGSGPHRLGGWSFGGLVAWEMACQLARAGQTVELLVLFDSFLPGAEAIVTDPVALIPHFLRDFGFDTPPVSAAGTAPSLVDALLREVYTELASRGGPPPTPGFDAFRRHFTVYTHSVAAAAEYGASTGYDGPIEFFRATRGANGARATDGWTRAHSGAFRTHDVAGTHHDMLRRPAVEDVGSTLQAILDRARRSDSAGTS